MKTKEIRDKTNDELLAKANEAKKEILSIKVKKTAADGSPASPIKIRNLRRTVARINTILTEREIAAKKEVK